MDDMHNNAAPPRRSYFLDYMGSVTFHRTYSRSMLRWLVAKIKYLRSPKFCALSIDQDGLKAAQEERVLINLADPLSNQTVNGSSSTTRNANLANTMHHPLAPLDMLDEGSTGLPGDTTDLLPLLLAYNEIVEVVTSSDYEKRCIGFMIDKGRDQSFNLHVFQHENDVAMVKEIGETVRKFICWSEKCSPSCLSNLISKNVKREDLDSIRFEVMLLGKLQTKNDYPTQLNFVDEAVEKYHSLESEHAAAMEDMKMIEQATKETKASNKHDNDLQHISQSLIEGSRNGASDLLRRNNTALWNKERRPSLEEVRQQRCNSMDMSSVAAMRRNTGRTRHCSEPCNAATMGFDKNKTRLFQVGKQSVTLICPDQSTRNVEILFVNIARQTKGVKHRDHFGVFAKDHVCLALPHNNSLKEDNRLKCYLFKCSDEGVCDEIMQAMKQACHMCANGPDPLCTFHSLCKRIHTTSGGSMELSWIEKGTNLAAKYIAGSFTDAEQKKVKQKIEDCYNAHPPESKYERLVVVMEMIRQIFEDKQIEHDIKVKQMRDPQVNAMSKKFTFLKSRAKKSLTSIESLWGKGVQKMQEFHQETEHHIQSPVEKLKFTLESTRSAPSTPIAHPAATTQINASRYRHRSGSPATSIDTSPLAGSSHPKAIVQPEPLRPRCNTVGSPTEGSINVRRKLNMAEKRGDTTGSPSPLSTVTSSSMSNSSARSSIETTPVQSRSSTPLTDLTPEKKLTLSGRKLTFHQKIFNKVVTPRSTKKKSSKKCDFAVTDECIRAASLQKTPDQIRLAWRRAIREQVMLNKINKASSSAADATPAEIPLGDKLNYSEPGPCSEEMAGLWEELLETDRRDQCKIDKGILHAAVKKGVPRRIRGQVWSMLYEQWKSRDQDNRHGSLPAFTLPQTSYDKLLKKLTPHHHAILIDLGRTFPSHPYYSKQLDNGQLALFRILKAYSLIDDGVGYCQGLSFVAGLLLLHYTSQKEAFQMLCHLMADMGCRKLYLPDMAALRVAVYQLSRLLHDFHKDLYTHFEENDVTLMLFSAPWFMTMFASVLPFGFTARIFDLLFLEGISALFKAALCLLSHHKENLLKEESFENVVSYLKNNLPKMDDAEAEVVINEMFNLDIGEKLRIYEVEYAVLEDGDIFGEEEDDEDEDTKLKQKFARLEQAHQTVTKYNLELVEQLEAAQMQIESLRQGLADMANIDERRTLQVEQLKQDNELLRKNHRI